MKQIALIKAGSYPLIVRWDEQNCIVGRPSDEVMGSNKLAILQDAVDGPGVFDSCIDQLRPLQVADPGRIDLGEHDVGLVAR